MNAILLAVLSALLGGATALWLARYNRVTEHDKWIRAERLKAYIDYWTALDAMELEPIYNPAKDDMHALETQLTLARATMRIMFLGDSASAEAAQEVAANVVFSYYEDRAVTADTWQQAMLRVGSAFYTALHPHSRERLNQIKVFERIYQNERSGDTAPQGDASETD